MPENGGTPKYAPCGIDRTISPHQWGCARYEPQFTIHSPVSPSYVETVVNSRSAYIQVQVDKGNDHPIAGYSESDEIDTTGEILGPGKRKFRINIHGDGYRTVTL